QGIAELDQVPLGDARLVAEAVAAALGVGRVGGPVRVVVVHPAVWAIVDGQAVDGHVVRVHDAVDEADTHPVDDHVRRAPADFLKPGEVDVPARLAQVGEVGANAVVRQLAKQTEFTPGGGQLEVAEAYKGRRYPANHRARFIGGVAVVEDVPQHLLAGFDQGQGPGSGHPQVVHGLAAEEFADGRAQHRQPIRAAGIGSGPGALQLQGPALPVCHYFAEVGCAAIAELTGPGAELMAAVDHGEGLHARQLAIAGKDLEELRGFAPRRVLAEQAQDFRGTGYQPWFGDRPRIYPRIAGSRHLTAKVIEFRIARQVAHKAVVEQQGRFASGFRGRIAPGL